MRTVGVEEELLLVDPETGEPRALSAAVLARAERDPADSEVFEKELHGQMLEFATHPQSSLAKLQEEIVRWRADAARHAAGTGAAVAALATSPLPVSPKVSTSERYQWMVDRYGLATQEQMVCGCHVHVSVESDEEGVAVLDRIRDWLPVLTALSANSPFWQGKETGYRSYRRQVWERWPSAGPTEPFGSPEEYHRRTDAMVATGAVLDRHMAYYDARLSDNYPTVEIRVSDVCLDADTPRADRRPGPRSGRDRRPAVAGRRRAPGARQREPAQARGVAGVPLRSRGGPAPPPHLPPRPRPRGGRRAPRAPRRGARRGR
ncbi:YbdK family carboxylate-amine ligase [Streptomyces sp. MJP52]|nr:YbdK family carboxylate-amine ligase [Streptomyces sp. MJP52]